MNRPAERPPRASEEQLRRGLSMCPALPLQPGPSRAARSALAGRSVPPPGRRLISLGPTPRRSVSGIPHRGVAVRPQSRFHVKHRFLHQRSSTSRPLGFSPDESCTPTDPLSAQTLEPAMLAACPLRPVERGATRAPADVPCGATFWPCRLRGHVPSCNRPYPVGRDCKARQVPACAARAASPSVCPRIAKPGGAARDL